MVMLSLAQLFLHQSVRGAHSCRQWQFFWWCRCPCSHRDARMDCLCSCRLLRWKAEDLLSGPGYLYKVYRLCRRRLGFVSWWHGRRSWFLCISSLENPGLSYTSGASFYYNSHYQKSLDYHNVVWGTVGKHSLRQVVCSVGRRKWEKPLPVAGPVILVVSQTCQWQITWI